MLGYRQACPGDYECRGCRNVESLGAARAGSGRINEAFVIRGNARSAVSHRFRQSGQFINRLALDFQSDQGRSDLPVSCLGVE